MAPLLGEARKGRLFVSYTTVLQKSLLFELVVTQVLTRPSPPVVLQQLPYAPTRAVLILVRRNILLPQKNFTGLELTGNVHICLVSRMDD